MNWQNHFAERTKFFRTSSIRELVKRAHDPSVISFTGGLPAAELFPSAELARAAAEVLRSQSAQALQYGATEGLSELREWIAQEHGVEAENVLITSGAQQALDLIGRVFLDVGDAVGVESPTYSALLGCWAPHGVRFVPFGPNFEGTERCKLLYCMSNFKNPSGETLTLRERETLARSVHRSATILVEDDPYRELRFEGEPLPTVLALNRRAGRELAGEVIYTGSFSKIVAPGLRVGWTIAPAQVIRKLVQGKHTMDLHTSTFNQHLILALMRSGFLADHLAKIRAEYQRRRDSMLEALHLQFGGEIRCAKPEGGMFVLARFQDGTNATKLLARALEEGVAFIPGTEFFLNGSGENSMRLNFSHVHGERVAEGVARLARAWRDQKDTRGNWTRRRAPQNEPLSAS